MRNELSKCRQIIKKTAWNVNRSKDKSVKKAEVNSHTTRSTSANTPASKKVEPKIPKLNLELSSNLEDGFALSSGMVLGDNMDADLKRQVLQSITDLVPKILPGIITAVIPKVIEQIMPIITKSI